jgi:precorrin-4 methylase
MVKIERIRLHTGDRDIIYSLREQVRSLEKLDEHNKELIKELSTAVERLTS